MPLYRPGTLKLRTRALLQAARYTRKKSPEQRKKLAIDIRKSLVKDRVQRHPAGRLRRYFRQNNLEFRNWQNSIPKRLIH